MPTSFSPSTPQGRTGAIAAAPSSQNAKPSPGPWQHPQIREINQRLAASTFTDQHVRRIITNVIGLAALILARRALPNMYV